MALTACSSDLKQAWMLSYVTVFAGQTVVLQSPSLGSPFTLGSGTSTRARVQINSLYWSASSSSEVGGYLSLAGKQSTVGTAVIRGPSNDFQLAWDVSGPGTGDTGFLFALQGNPSYCLAKSGSSVVVAPCNSAQAGQRWKYNACLINDAGGHLDMDTSTTPPQPIIMAGDCRADYSWSFTISGLKATDPANSKSYYFTGDPAQGTVFFTPTASSSNVPFVIGGAWDGK
jgi:hypothetical protein